MTAFDNWLTNQSENPVHFVFDPIGSNYDWEIEHTEIDGFCSSCKATIGIDSDSGSANSYWQIDVDAEHLLCEDCYEKVTVEI
jgi:hypothetical protein